jgi:hypothetical protein
MKKLFLIPLFALICTFTVCAQTGNTTTEAGIMKIKITVDTKEITAVISDNAMARDFVTLLPLTLTLEDYNRTEKVSNLPRKLSTVGTSQGHDPQIGDICIYVPWGNLCIFYRDFGYSNGLVLLGKIESGMDALSGSGTITAKFEVDATSLRFD